MDHLFTIIWLLTTLWAVLFLLIHRREPSSTIAWLLFVLLVPIGGPLLLFLLGPQRITRAATKRTKEIENRLTYFATPSATSAQDKASAEMTKGELLSEERQILNLAEQVSPYAVTSGNQLEILPDPALALESMQQAINQAKSFVHLEYYMIRSDEVTQQLFDDLLKAIKRGVEVRILYDSLGSLFLKNIYFRDLKKNGARIAGFLPLSSVTKRLNLNFRNHRKILIVDGKIGFTGGANIGKQYLGKRTKTQWRDNLMKVEGPVVRQLQDVFARDWHFATKEDLFQIQYYPTPSQVGDAIIQMLASGPDSPFHTLHQAIFLALNSAQKQILLTTPYFIPDLAVITSLTVAARKGIEVCLLLPQKSDSILVQYASRSFYENMLEAGVTIFEYQPTILHAKMLIVDNRWTILGTSNMDIRSFRHNFELNLLIYGPSAAVQASQLFHFDIKSSEKLELGSFLNRPFPQKLAENACRLLSPVL